MNASPNDFRELYASLSDEALLEVRREDLIEVAQQCYDAELAERGLTREPAEVEIAQEPEHVLEELAVVAKFSSVSEANLARELLRSAGIPAGISVQRGLIIDGHPVELPVVVPASLAEVAREVLEHPISEEDLSAQAEAAGLLEPFEWQDEYAIGHREVDMQHRRVFATATDLQFAAEDPDAKEEFSRILHELIEYATEHFAYEEELMEAAGYPQLAQHREEHKRFYTKLAELSQGFEAGKVEPAAIVEALAGWLPQHVITDDRMMGAAIA